MKRFLLTLSLWLGLICSAVAQNPQCPTRPLGDSSNACSSTAFVQNQLAAQAPIPGFITCGANQFVNSVAATSVCAQPSFSNLSGRATLAQLPQGIANSIWINPTGSTADMQNLAVPACANDGVHALVYVNASGLQCATITASVTGPGTAVVGDLPTFSNTGGTALADSGFNASQIPGLLPSTATVTISNNSPGVVTWTAHGLSANAVVYFCTTGALPTGLTACAQAASAQLGLNSNPTLYYVVGSSITANTFQVATSIANAKAGTSVNTSSAGSGTHTGFANVFACAGCVGEYIFNVTQITNGNVTSNADTVFNTISLPPGVWKAGGSGGVFGAATTVFQTSHNSIGLGNTTICTTPYCGTTDWHFASNNNNGELFTFNDIIIPVFSTSSLNAVCEPVFTTSTATCFGELHAVRVH